MKKARHKKEKHIEAQTELHPVEGSGGSGDGAQPTVVEGQPQAPADSREGDRKCFFHPQNPWDFFIPRMLFKFFDRLESLTRLIARTLLRSPWSF